MAKMAAGQAQSLGQDPEAHTQVRAGDGNSGSSLVGFQGGK